jgi:hypothetical protein
LFSVFRISAFHKVDAASFPAHTRRMAKKAATNPIGGTSSTSPRSENPAEKSGTRGTRPSALVDTRVIYCGDNLEQVAKLPDGPCRTGQYWGLPREITSRTTLPRRLRRISRGSPREIISRATIPHCLHHISRGETKEKRAFEDRHENTKAYIDYLRPRCVQLARVLKTICCF